MTLPKYRPPMHPGEILLEEFLNPLQMTQQQAAAKMGISLNRLNEIVRGKRGITADTALRLASLCKTTPQFWLNNWDLWHARRDMRGAAAAARTAASLAAERRRTGCPVDVRDTQIAGIAFARRACRQRGTRVY
jgi:addiction module HigA family antidote